MPVHIIVMDIRTTEMTIDQQVALDEALVPHTRQLRIGKRNFCLRSDITSKESTLQLVYGVLRLTPFYKAFLEDFVYQVEHKDSKKSNEMYYPRKTQSSFETTITSPTFVGTRLLTLEKGKQPAKSSKEKDEGTGILPGVPDVPTNEKISWKSSDEDDDEVNGRSDDQEDEDDQDDDQDDNNDDQDTDNDGDDFVHPKLSIHEEEEAKDEERFDLFVQTPENSDDKGNDDASLGMNVSDEEGQDTEDDDEELYRDVNINLEGRDVQMTDVHTIQEFEDTHVTLTLVHPNGIDSPFESTPYVDVQASTTVAPLTLTAPTLPLPTIPTISQVPQAPTPPTTAPSTFLQDLPNFSSLLRFDHRLKTLEANFFEFMQTN
nr:hypothetical protein [Tanacetum cinerariifolium]